MPAPYFLFYDSTKASVFSPEIKRFSGEILCLNPIKTEYMKGTHFCKNARLQHLGFFVNFRNKRQHLKHDIR